VRDSIKEISKMLSGIEYTREFRGGLNNEEYQEREKG